MSFPDPHHPWDPPQSEVRPDRLARGAAARGLPRVGARSARRSSTPSPATGASGTTATLVSNYEAPGRLGAGHPHRRPGARGERPQRGRVRADRRGARPGARAGSAERGWADDVDVVFTTDHGELQGDFGLLFKGPYHVDALMRLPLVWRPAPSAGDRPPAVVTPAGRAGRPRADLLRHRRRRAARRGCRAAPAARRRGCRASRGFEQVLTEWDSELFGVDVHLRTVFRDGLRLHRLLRRAPCTTAPRASSTRHPTTPSSGSTAGTTRRGVRGATSCSGNCTTTRPRCTSRGCGSRHRSSYSPLP